MSLNVVRFFGLILTAIAMSAGFAHLMALPNKIDMPPEVYLNAQAAYRGWALLAFVILLAMLITGVQAFMTSHRLGPFLGAMGALICQIAAQVVFWTYTFPANQATRNWTMLPDDWQILRAQWEYSHALGAGLMFVALALLVAAVLSEPERGRFS